MQPSCGGGASCELGSAALSSSVAQAGRLLTRPSARTQPLRFLHAGNLALGVMHGAVQDPKAGRYLQFAERMAYACIQLYNNSATGGWGWRDLTVDRGTCGWEHALLGWRQHKISTS